MSRTGKILAVAMAVAVAGCAGSEPAWRGPSLPDRPPSSPQGAAPSRGETPALARALPAGWPYESSRQELLAAFLACASPGELIELQRGVDMAKVVERLDDWSAVRLGALGPLLTGAEILNRKRAAFLVTASKDYGVARAEVFALYIIHSAFTSDVREVLSLLAEDKRLGDTLGRMGAVREVLGQRGIRLADYADRPERPGDAVRGLASAAREALSSSELSRGALGMRYYAQLKQLPPAYQQVLEEVERAEMGEVLAPGSVTVRSLDALTFGVPLGFYNLLAGTCRGVSALSQGKYEQSANELAAAAVLVALYAGGKALRPSPQAIAAKRTGDGLVETQAGRIPELGFGGLAAVVERLWARLGQAGTVQLARYIQASREAAVLVYEGGEAGAMALYEARGDVTRARTWMAKAVPERPGRALAKTGLGAVEGGSLASLVDEAAGLTRDVLKAKFIEAETSATGLRLSREVAVLEQARPSLERPPPGVPSGSALWSEYIAYYDERVAALKGERWGVTTTKKPVEPPRTWDSYRKLREDFQRGLAYEKARAASLRLEAMKPPELRTHLRDFRKPRIQQNAGVRKADLRFTDVLVLEEDVGSGNPPRVETFSFKSRDFTQMATNDVRSQLKADAVNSMRYYGGAVDIRTPDIGLRGKPVRVEKVHLIYDAGLKPSGMGSQALQRILEDVAVETGVEVRFE